jgi:hypothetical protein
VEGFLVLRRIAVRLNVTASEDRMSARLVIQDADSMDTLRLTDGSFLFSLGLEREDDDTAYAHGSIRSAPDRPAYPIRSNRSLYEALDAYLRSVDEQE